MKKLNLKKFLSLLLTLTMCLSLVTSAMALDEEGEPEAPTRDTVSEKLAGSIFDAIYESSSGKDAVDKLEDKEEEKGLTSEVEDAIEEAVGEVTPGEKDEEDEYVEGKEPSATKTDAIVEEASKAVTGEDKDGNPVEDSAQGVVDDAEEEAENVIDESVKNDEDVTYNKVEVTVGEDGKITVTETEDKAEIKGTSKDGSDEKEEAEGQQVDEYVGKVETKKDEKGNDVIDVEKSTGKSKEIAEAADDAEAAKKAAEDALKKFEDINTEPTTEREKTEALNAANSAAKDAKDAADDAKAAAEKAADAYAQAKAAYDAALDAYQTATGAENIVGNTEGSKLDALTEESDVGAALKEAEDTAAQKEQTAKNAAAEQLKAAKKALDAAAATKAQAETAKTTADAYAKNAQEISKAIAECLQAESEGKNVFDAKAKLYNTLEDGINKQLDELGKDGKEEAKKDSNRLAAIEGVNGKQGELNIKLGELDLADQAVTRYTTAVGNAKQELEDARTAEAKAQEAYDNATGFAAKAAARIKLNAAKGNTGAKESNLGIQQGLLEIAEGNQKRLQGEVKALEDERKDIRDRNGVNVDLYRLAVEVEVFGPVAVLDSKVLSALQEEIDYRAETAKQAADRAQEASDNYQAALDAVAKAQRDVEKLAVAGPNVEAARRAAEQRLKDAEAALTAAKDVKDLAIGDAEAAIDAYKKAADTVEEIKGIEIPEIPTREDLEGTGGTDGGTDVEDATEDADGTDGTEDTGIVIEEPAVPLAGGPVTRGQFVDYLWRHEGSPASEAPTFDDVPADYEFAPAIGWAQAAGLVTAVEGNNFQPEELVTVEMVRGILGNFASVFGTNAVEAAALTTLVGEDGEAVLNCDEVLAEFFGEEYVSPVDESELETEVEPAA